MEEKSMNTAENIIVNKITEGYGLAKFNDDKRFIKIGYVPNCNGDFYKDYSSYKNTKEELILFVNKYNIVNYSIEQTDNSYELSNQLTLSNDDYIKVISLIKKC